MRIEAKAHMYARTRSQALTMTWSDGSVALNLSNSSAQAQHHRVSIRRLANAPFSMCDPDSREELVETSLW